ncbi:MAG: hypothetical protein ABFE13_00170 [Phycisphaerales bacterium]
MQARIERIMTTAAVAMAGLCLLAGTLRADIGIKPAFVEVNLDAGRPSGVFFVSNLGDTEERFRVNAVHFTYTEKGALQASPTGQYSLAPYIRFNPRELTLAPKTQRAVRFAIVPKEKLVEGEYWASMELESLAVNEALAQDEKTGRSVRLKTVTAIMAPIFGTVGKASYSGQVQDLQLAVENGSPVIKTLVTATGTGRLGLKGRYEILDASGVTVNDGPLGSAYVLRGARRWLTRKVEAGIPNRQYTVKVSFEAAHLAQPLAMEALVTWPQVPSAEAQAAAESVAQPKSKTDQQNQPEGSTDGNDRTEAQGSAGS